jgi:RNA polymerase sigma-70 factor (ECF subfamily)
VIRSKKVQDVETQWLINARSGDAQSFGRLVDAYQTPVYNLCYRMLGDHYEAEDAAQEVFLRAYKSMDRYDPQRPFSTWILSIAAHYCIDLIRKRRMKTVSIDELPYQQITDHSPQPETALSNREREEQVRVLLDSLSADDRAAVVMRYWYDFSYEEIAAALNLSVSAVKSRLHRARQTLADRWTKHSLNPQSLERTRNESPAF